jgi:hypothetical protein
MATIVVHGTMTIAHAKGSPWWWNSWGPRGFLAAVARGMAGAGQAVHDLWRVGGRPVSDIAELNPKWNLLTGKAGGVSQHRGHFCWPGSDSYVVREAGAVQLARYLNLVSGLLGRGEPLRVIGHSHGCNVIKMASGQRSLAPRVRIDRAVFLACPHFVAAGQRASYFPYRLDPGRFGEILNLSSESDSVQVGMADALPGPPGFRPGDFLPPKAHRSDSDAAARSVYRDFIVPTVDRGTAAHTVMHGAAVGEMIGAWLVLGFDFGAALAHARGELLPVARGDVGA